MDRRRFRHPPRPAGLTAPAPTPPGLVDRACSPSEPSSSSASASTATPAPTTRSTRAGHRDLPPRQPLRRIAPVAALPAARHPHPRRHHGRAPRRSRLRPALPTGRIGVHPPRQRPRRPPPCRDRRTAARRANRGRDLPRRTALPARRAATLPRPPHRTGPARAERLAGLRHLLPPRPAGLFALLDAAPGADVVVINHAGLDPYPTFAELARHVPLAHPIHVTATRIPRTDIPDDPALRTAWLDQLWCDQDQWVHEQLDR